MGRSKLWFAIATIFTLVNVVGAPLALFAGEWMHLLTHIVLGTVGAMFMWRFAGARRAEALAGAARGNELRADRQLDELQQSVDAIALEVERLGESHRYAAKLAAERVAAENARREKEGGS
jgi:hypothetical protein